MAGKSDRPRIAIVEDDPLMRDYLGDVLSSEFNIVGVAAGLRAARGLMSVKPHLFLLDLGLPDGDGLSLVADIKAAGARVLILTAFGDRETVVAAIQAGADGYLLKDSSAATLCEGVSVTLAGGAPISAAAAVFLLERLRPAEAPAKSPAREEELTAREIELLRVFAKGASYKEAARALEVSPLTVGSYVKSIYRKLEVHSRGEAVYEAIRSRKLRLD
ncbi:response regulator [Terricaulis sp.]|uniref:response regulator n=1 Tax=Terricaulis sp. TaxID=2768686 RepID=UPI00378418B3